MYIDFEKYLNIDIVVNEIGVNNLENFRDKCEVRIINLTRQIERLCTHTNTGTSVQDDSIICMICGKTLADRYVTDIE